MKFCTYNTENLFIHLDKKYSKEEFFQLTNHDIQLMNHGIYKNGAKLFDIQNKSLESLDLLSQTIKNINADFYGLTEVGGKISLNNFNRFYLDEEFDTYIEESNSDRGIFTGALVKKNTFTKVESVNHGPRLNMSRNLMEFKLYKDGILSYIVIVCHLKSHRGHDNGIDKRYQEVKSIISLYHELESKNTNIPILIMGDFNGIAIKGQNQFEFDSIYYDTDLEDCLEITNYPLENRITHIGFDQNQKAKTIQLDYIFISKKFSNIIKDCSIYINLDDQGNPLIPKNYDERRKYNSSDHFPLILTIIQN